MFVCLGVRVQHHDQVMMQDGSPTESLVRVLLGVPALQGAIATFLLESLIAFCDGNDTAQADGSNSEASHLSAMILSQLDALDVATCSNETMDSLLEAFSAATPQLQAPLASVLGELVPAERTAGDENSKLSCLVHGMLHEACNSARE